MKNNTKIIILLAGCFFLLLLSAFLTSFFSIELSTVLWIFLVVAVIFVIAYTYELLPWPVLIPLTLTVGYIGGIRVREFVYEYTLFEAVIVLVFFGWLLQLIMAKKKPEINTLAWLFFSFIIFSIISLAWARNLSRAVIAIRILIYHFAVLLLIFNSVQPKKFFKYFLGVLPLAGLLVSWQLIGKVYDITKFQFVINREAIVTIVGAGVYVGAIIILTAILSYALFATTKNFYQRLLISLALAILVFAAFLPTSKVVILTLGLGGIYFLWRTRKAYKQTNFFLILISVVIFLVIFAAPFLENLVTRAVNWQSDVTTQFRIKEYRVYSYLISGHPWLGVGAGNLKVYSQDLLDLSEIKEADNFIVQILAELGVIGLALLALIIASLVRAFRKLRPYIKKKEDKIIFYAFGATFLMAFVNGMFEVTFIGLAYGIIFWYIVGLFFAWQRLKLTEKI